MRCLILGILAIVIFVTSSNAAPREPIISRITIRGTNIFDFETNTYIRRFPYTLINALHIKTRESVIRRELLFKVGDRFDPFLARETERNLRALSFIRAARVAKHPQRDGTVALVVHVNDSWTTEPQVNLGGVNHVDELEVGFKEKNLFGLGKEVSAFYNHAPLKDQQTYTYFDPQLVGSRWQMRGQYIDKTDGKERNIQVQRPFFSADTKWSAKTFHQHNSSIIREFENSAQVSEFEQTKEVGVLAGGLKIGGGRNVTNHSGLRYQKETRRYNRTGKTSPTRDIPDALDFQTLFLDLNSARVKFIETTRIDKMTRVEDINLGPVFRFSPGYSPKQITGQENTTQVEAGYEQRFLSKDGNLFHTAWNYSDRDTFNTPENQENQLKLRYYYRGFREQTWVFNTLIEWGHNLDPDNFITVGNKNGLRAFKDEELFGDRGFVFNIEDRIFLIDELANLVSVGAVVFYDAGYAWPKGRPIKGSQVKSDIGAGFRFGLTRSSREAIIRLDFSYRMQRVSSDDSKFVLTFGSEQAF